MHIRLGPCGVNEGTYWDDGCHQRIESIFVSYDSLSICSIQTVYKDFSNNIFIAPHHGPHGYEQMYSYQFEAVHLPPENPITRIDGYYDSNGVIYLELSTNYEKQQSVNSIANCKSLNKGKSTLFQGPCLMLPREEKCTYGSVLVELMMVHTGTMVVIKE
ncbi:jacalin-related lectin 33-like isoform X4 [Carex rostrata]